MSERRLERQRLQRRLLLERAMERVLAEDAERGREAGLATGSKGPLPEDVFFPEHGETLELLGRMLDRVGLLETCLALARHQEEDRDHWLRRLAFIEAQPRLRLQRAKLDQELAACFAGHFRRWGAAGPAGERGAAFEAAALLGVLREAERQWLAGEGRPALTVLVQEALGLLWPALYPHLRKHTR